jgi:hypothetical protein
MGNDTAHRPAAVYFVHQKTGARFKVVGRDVEAGTITLEGEYGTFTEKYDKELFVKNGYLLEKL